MKYFHFFKGDRKYMSVPGVDIPIEHVMILRRHYDRIVESKFKNCTKDGTVIYDKQFKIGV